MRNNSVFPKLVLIISILTLSVFQVYSGDKNDLFVKDSYRFKLKEKPKSIFKEAEKLRKKSSLLSMDLDLKLGTGWGNTNYDVQKQIPVSQKLDSTKVKMGPTAGVILSLNFIGFGFTTGVQYVNKGFEYSTGEQNDLEYFNIPLQFYFDFNVGKNIRLDGSVGPYLGVLITQDENPVIMAKNFDFGLGACLQLAYMFNRYFGVLLGSQYEFGGLNNLGSNEYVSKITTSTVNVYTGLKIEF